MNIYRVVIGYKTPCGYGSRTFRAVAGKDETEAIREAGLRFESELRNKNNRRKFVRYSSVDALYIGQQINTK